MLLVTWYHLIYLTLLVPTLSVVKYEYNGHYIDFYQLKLESRLKSKNQSPQFRFLVGSREA